MTPLLENVNQGHQATFLTPTSSQTMDSDSSSSTLEPTVVKQKGQWTAEQKGCIRDFSVEWHGDDADRNAILLRIIAALQGLSEPPTIPDLGVVCLTIHNHRVLVDTSMEAYQEVSQRQLPKKQGHETRS